MTVALLYGELGPRSNTPTSGVYWKGQGPSHENQAYCSAQWTRTSCRWIGSNPIIDDYCRAVTAGNEGLTPHKMTVMIVPIDVLCHGVFSAVSYNSINCVRHITLAVLVVVPVFYIVSLGASAAPPIM